MDNTAKITYKIQRYNPETGNKPYMQEFSFPSKPGMTILDGLIYINENIDSTLAFRASCRMGICGSCAMLIKNYPRLACHTQIEELSSHMITIKPLPNFSVIKDLLVNFTSLFEKHRSIKPFIVRSDKQELFKPTIEYKQLPGEVEAYEQFSYCTKCGICLAACPTSASDRCFLGPQALTQCYRYCTDSRDTGDTERMEIADSNHGVWRCHLAGACSEACPKGVDPALGIQLLKRKMAVQSIVPRKKGSPAILYSVPTETKPKIEFPPFTIMKD